MRPGRGPLAPQPEPVVSLDNVAWDSAGTETSGPSHQPGTSTIMQLLEWRLQSCHGMHIWEAERVSVRLHGGRGFKGVG